ncbi:MAG: hypothetical protein V4793_42205, partial [Paraburkholderia tropica]
MILIYQKSPSRRWGECAARCASDNALGMGLRGRVRPCLRPVASAFAADGVERAARGETPQRDEAGNSTKDLNGAEREETPAQSRLPTRATIYQALA